MLKNVKNCPLSYTMDIVLATVLLQWVLLTT